MKVIIIAVKGVWGRGELIIGKKIDDKINNVRKNKIDVKNIKVSKNQTQERFLFFPVTFIGIFLLAVFLRLYLLDMRIFHHDESAVGIITYKLFKEGIYSYDPSFHGPFMPYVTAEMFRFFGDSDYSARLLPAFLGAAMLLLLVPLRRYIGNNGVLLSAFFLALSPSFLYYSRFYREDIFIAFFSLLMLVCAVKYAEKHVEERYSIIRILYLFAGAFSLASMAALKENAYIAIALIAFFLLFIFIREKWYRGFVGKLRKLDKKLLIILAEAVFFILGFLVIFSLYYTGNFLDFQGMYAAVDKAVIYWYEMHQKPLLGGSPFYYLPILGRYELPVLVFGVIGIIHYFKRNILMSFLGYWAISNFIIYSYLQEKVPWLILNPLLPLIIIAGAYIGELLPRLKFDRVGAAVIVFLVISSSYSVYSSIFLNFYDYANTDKEPLIQFRQVPQEFKEYLPKFYAWASELNGKPASIKLPNNDPGSTFLWYFRHYNNVVIYY